MDKNKPFPWFRLIAIIATIALFVAEYGFNIMAKTPPWWAFAVPGLLALGIEGPAVGRLIMQMLRASVQPPKDDK